MLSTKEMADLAITRGHLEELVKIRSDDLGEAILDSPISEDVTALRIELFALKNFLHWVVEKAE